MLGSEHVWSGEESPSTPSLQTTQATEFTGVDARRAGARKTAWRRAAVEHSLYFYTFVKTSTYFFVGQSRPAQLMPGNV